MSPYLQFYWSQLVLVYFVHALHHIYFLKGHSLGIIECVSDCHWQACRFELQPALAEQTLGLILFYYLLHVK
jgi:hypothetical protein